MALLKQWRDRAYDEKANKGDLQRLWKDYFAKEKEIYAELLKNPDEVVTGTVAELAEKYGVGAAQIPVAWAIAKGTLPIIGVTKENQVLDAVKAASIALTAEDSAELEKVADSLDLNVIRFWEKEMK